MVVDSEQVNFHKRVNVSSIKGKNQNQSSLLDFTEFKTNSVCCEVGIALV